MAIVYQHIRLDTNEVFYVGLGIEEKRAYETYSRNIVWKRIVKKSGYKINIFAKGLTLEDAMEVEKSEIARIGRADLGKGPLINLTDGGEGLFNPSEEVRNKISKKNIERFTKKEEREKISKKLKSSQFCKDLRKRQTGSGNVSHRPEVKAKIAESVSNLWKNESYIKNRKPEPIVKCPNCGKNGKNRIMKRWHFDRCKNLNN